MYKLHAFFTQNSMKPLYVLEELGVDFEFCYVDLMKGENRSDNFRAMTPVGKVPVLEHDGKFLFESGAICRYTANVEDSELYPQDAYERAQVDQWMDYLSCHLGRSLTEIYFESIIKPVAGMGDPDKAACEKAAVFAYKQFKPLERHLGSASWLANDKLSIADLFALAYMAQIPQINFSLDDFPNVSQWYTSLEELDSTARARARVQPHIEALLG